MKEDPETSADKWKIIGIVSIFLLVAAILFLTWAWSLGNEQIEKERMCMFESCEGHESYFYANEICYCYSNDTLQKQVSLSESVEKTKLEPEKQEPKVMP